MEKVITTLYLDTRRNKKNDKFPLKIRVYHSNLKKQKLFPTNLDLSIDEYEKISNTKRNYSALKDKKDKVIFILGKAQNTADSLDPFSFKSFETKLYGVQGEEENVFFQFDKYHKSLSDNEQTGTASNYACSKKSIELFCKEKYKNNSGHLNFREITVDFLEKYESYIFNRSKVGSKSTVGFYLRPLRRIFNIAVENNIVKKSYYPFGVGKYQIPESRNIKKALSKDILKKLYFSTPFNTHQEKAKDFWFLAYLLQGLNISDILHLKYSDIKNMQILLTRNKTKNTKRKITKIIIDITEDSWRIILKYKTNKTDGYVFDTLNESMNSEEKKTKVQNFVRYINQHLKNLCTKNDISEHITSSFSRHSYATTIIRTSGGNKALAQELLGHSSIITTERYFAGFESEDRKNVNENLLNFNDNE